MLKQTCIERSVYKGQYGACVRNIPPGKLFGPCSIGYAFERIGDKHHEPFTFRPATNYSGESFDRGHSRYDGHCARSYPSSHHKRPSHKSNSHSDFRETTPTSKTRKSRPNPSEDRLSEVESQIYKEVQNAPRVTSAPKSSKKIPNTCTETKENCRKACDRYMNSLLSPGNPDLSYAKSKKLECITSNTADLILRRIATQLQAIQHILKSSNSCHTQNTQTNYPYPVSPYSEDMERIVYPCNRGNRSRNDNKSTCCARGSSNRIGCCFKSKCCRKRNERSKFNYPGNSSSSSQRNRPSAPNDDYVNDLICKYIEANTQFCTMLPQFNNYPCDTSNYGTEENLITTEKIFTVDRNVQTQLLQMDANVQASCTAQTIDQLVSTHIQPPIVNSDYMNRLIGICNDRYMQSYLTQQSNQNQLQGLDSILQRHEAVAPINVKNEADNCTTPLNEGANIILSNGNPTKPTDNKIVSTVNEAPLNEALRPAKASDKKTGSAVNDNKGKNTPKGRRNLFNHSQGKTADKIGPMSIEEPIISEQLQNFHNSIPNNGETMDSIPSNFTTTASESYHEKIEDKPFEDDETAFRNNKSTSIKIEPSHDQNTVTHKHGSCMTECRFAGNAPPVTYNSVETETIGLDNMQKISDVIPSNQSTQTKPSIDMTRRSESKSIDHSFQYSASSQGTSRDSNATFGISDDKFSENAIVPNQSSSLLADRLKLIDAANSPILFTTTAIPTNALIPMQTTVDTSLQTVQLNIISTCTNTCRKELTPPPKEDKDIIAQGSSLLGTVKDETSRVLSEDINLKITYCEVIDAVTNTALISQEDRGSAMPDYSLDCACDTAEIAVQAKVVEIDMLCGSLNYELADDATCTTSICQKEQAIDIQKSLLPMSYKKIADITSSLIDQPHLRPIGDNDIQVLYMPKVFTKNIDTNTSAIDQTDASISAQASLIAKLKASCEKCKSKFPIPSTKVPTDIGTNTSKTFTQNQKTVCIDTLVVETKIPCPNYKDQPVKPVARPKSRKGYTCPKTFEDQVSENVDAALYYLRQPPLSDDSQLPRPKRTCTTKSSVKEYSTSDAKGVSQTKPSEKGKELEIKSVQNCPCPSVSGVGYNKIVSMHKSDITQCRSFKNILPATDDSKKSSRPRKCSCSPNSTNAGPSAKPHKCFCGKKNTQP